MTTKRGTIRRWMLAPKILRGVTIGIGQLTEKEIEHRFNAAVGDIANVFWLVRWQGAECGIVMMCPVPDGWEPHLCLATQRPHTREVMRELFRRVSGTTITLKFCVLHARMECLANDLGFGPPLMLVSDLPPGAAAPWCARQLRV